MPPIRPPLRYKVLIATGVGFLGAGTAYQVFPGRNSNAPILNPSTFTPFSLKAKDRTSSTSAIFRVQQDGLQENETVKLLWDRAIWSVEIKQPQLQIARSYTPIPLRQLDDATEGNELELLIRKEHKGEVSTFLHKLPEAANVEVRGPHVECEIPENTREVIFLAGGTGIAPALQVAHVLRKRPGTKMTILWANRSREECQGAEQPQDRHSRGSWTWLSQLWRHQDNMPPRIEDKNTIVAYLDRISQLTAFPQGQDDRCRVEYFVDEDSSFITSADVTRHVQSSVDSVPETSSAGSRIIFVSGPDGFVDYWAGKKVWRDGQEAQGPLGGMLSRLNLKGWSVWKL